MSTERETLLRARSVDVYIQGDSPLWFPYFPVQRKSRAREILTRTTIRATFAALVTIDHAGDAHATIASRRKLGIAVKVAREASLFVLRVLGCCWCCCRGQRRGPSALFACARGAVTFILFFILFLITAALLYFAISCHEGSVLVVKILATVLSLTIVFFMATFLPLFLILSLTERLPIVPVVRHRFPHSYLWPNDVEQMTDVDMGALGDDAAREQALRRSKRRAEGHGSDPGRKRSLPNITMQNPMSAIWSRKSVQRPTADESKPVAAATSIVDAQEERPAASSEREPLEIGVGGSDAEAEDEDTTPVLSSSEYTIARLIPMYTPRPVMLFLYVAIVTNLAVSLFALTSTNQRLDGMTNLFCLFVARPPLYLAALAITASAQAVIVRMQQWTRARLYSTPAAARGQSEDRGRGATAAASPVGLNSAEGLLHGSWSRALPWPECVRAEYLAQVKTMQRANGAVARILLITMLLSFLVIVSQLASAYALAFSSTQGGLGAFEEGVIKSALTCFSPGNGTEATENIARLIVDPAVGLSETLPTSLNMFAGEALVLFALIVYYLVSVYDVGTTQVRAAIAAAVHQPVGHCAALLDTLAEHAVAVRLFGVVVNKRVGVSLVLSAITGAVPVLFKRISG